MDKLQWIHNKIVGREQLSSLLNGLRTLNNKIVFTNGCFDLIHRGHIEYLAAAASMGNRLVIGLNSDASVSRLKGPGRPVINEQDRALQLAALVFVDFVCLFEEDTPENLITSLRPDVLVKGGDYKEADIAGAPFVKSYGGTVTTIPFVEGYSSTKLIGRINKL